jgi:hypothetical protein
VLSHTRLPAALLLLLFACLHDQLLGRPCCGVSKRAPTVYVLHACNVNVAHLDSSREGYVWMVEGVCEVVCVCGQTDHVFYPSGRGLWHQSETCVDLANLATDDVCVRACVCGNNLG